MTLPIETFDIICDRQRKVMESVSSSILDLINPGSILNAIIESNGANSMWLQAINTSLLVITRLATCSGNDVDTFINDFGFSRYQGNPSSGTITFSRLTTTSAGVVPVGSVVSVSSTNNLNFHVSLDVTNPNYNPSTNSYELGIGISSINVPCQCQLNGSIGNFTIGQIDTINSILTGVDFVNNAAAFANGIDQWSDQTTKAEFALYIQSLTRATLASILFATSTTPGVKRFNAVENKSVLGADQPGFFYVVVDDGSGVPNVPLIDNVSDLLDSYRGFTIAYTVIGPVAVPTTITMDVKLIPTPSETQSQISAKIILAMQNYIFGLGFNSLFPISRIPEIVYDSDPNILNVRNVVLNGSSTADLTTNNVQLFTSPNNSITITYI